jgi:hypothetical protein
LEDIVKDYDAVLDTMSFSCEERTLGTVSRVLKEDGHYLNVMSSDWALKDGKEVTIGPTTFYNLFTYKLGGIFGKGAKRQYDTISCNRTVQDWKKFSALLPMEGFDP